MANRDNGPFNGWMANLYIPALRHLYYLKNSRKQDNMPRRFLSISFPYLVTDWWTIRQPDLKQLPVVITAPSHGRMIITAANRLAENENIHAGMVLADARAVVPGIHVIDDHPGL